MPSRIPPGMVFSQLLRPAVEQCTPKISVDDIIRHRDVGDESPDSVTMSIGKFCLPPAGAFAAEGKRKRGRAAKPAASAAQRKRRARSSEAPGAAKGPSGAGEIFASEAHYTCSSCGKEYTSTVMGNPCWLVERSKCTSCHALQFPRVDILHEVNAALAHPMDRFRAPAPEAKGPSQAPPKEKDAAKAAPKPQAAPAPKLVPSGGASDIDASSDTTEESVSTVSTVDDVFDAPGAFALSRDKAAKLLVLLNHAERCGGAHLHSGKHQSVCTTAKALLLHGTACGAPPGACRMPWCRTVKALLKHKKDCKDSAGCTVCRPPDLKRGMFDLHSLNQRAAPEPLLEPASPPLRLAAEEDLKLEPIASLYPESLFSPLPAEEEDWDEADWPAF